jgi:molecular chaperone HtpG
MPAEITLPPFLTAKLAQAPHRHVVYKALENFSDWFRSSRLPFFPDYTDHGIQHIEQVLATAANLIPDQARDYFSGADAAALILAVLLHDSALHLTDAGVWQLIKDAAAPYKPVAPFDQKGWAQTWDDFIFLARRWDDTKLAQVFGSAEPGGLPTAAVRDPFAHWQNLTRTDNLLIGEFIRQQHPRLAHEMALHGVPGTTGTLLKLDDSLPAEWRDLVGLIARSHGLPLRTCLDYLKNASDFGEYARREYQGVHAVYLMALLRVADYIQIQGDRTSDRIFSYKKIYSSVSTIEHKVHQSVRNITNTADDPEALSILARPDEVSVFLRLKEWLAGIQQELDGSWAVLGEVYGRHEQLRYLGLTFRRVLSNLDDVPKFAATVPYVPDRIRFDVARAELLKLLIGPLYGDDPSYGVRELMQNAIDAVREYDQFVLDNPQYATVPRREQEADVVVELGPLDEATGYAIMTISDRGIGMTEATIRDYFLKAGASYRQNHEWKTAFETDVSEGAKAKVLRSGRFGVGALAAFLIGGKIYVETRHVSQIEGYKFETSLNADTISVIREKNVFIGTKIELKVDYSTFQDLIKPNELVTRPAYWDWYCFDYPTIQRIINLPKKGRFVQEAKYSFNSFLNDGWRSLPLNETYEVYWSRADAPGLICNGIFVNNSSTMSSVLFNTVPRPSVRGSYQSIKYPNIIVLDRDGLLPLNLQRNELRTGEFPFGYLLIEDLLSEMLAFILFNVPANLNSQSIPSISLYPWFVSEGATGAVIACINGYAIRCATLLDNLVVRRIVQYLNPSLKIKLISHDVLVFGGGLNLSFYDSRVNFRILNNNVRYYNEAKYEVRRLVYREGYARKKASSLVKANPNIQKDEEKSKVEGQNGPWLLLSSDKCPASGFTIEEWPKLEKSVGVERHEEELAISERFYPEGTYIKASSEPWLLDELWLKYFGKNWIPFDLKERIAKFPETAEFFAERYPQVVPDEAWALLGGKPTTA